MGTADIKNILTFAAGLVVSAFSVALSTKAVLGTSPISAVPFVMSLYSSLTFGTITFIFNMVFVVMGIFVMGRNYRPVFLLTVPVVIVFSWLCDVFTYDVLSSVNVTEYALQWVLVVLSALSLAFGISLQLASNLTMLPADLFVNFVNIRWGFDYGKVKVTLDVSLIILAVIISLLCFGRLEGVREGTVFAALTVGLFIRTISKIMKDHGFYEFVNHRTIEFTKKGTEQ